MMKKFFGIISILFLSFTLVACSGNSKNANKAVNEAAKNAQAEEQEKDEPKEGEDNSLENIKAKGKIVMGTSADFPPLEWVSYKDGGESYKGLDIEIAKNIADSLGLELEIKNMAFEGLLTSLKAGDIDMVIAGMAATDERKKEVDFSSPYYTGGQCLLVRKEDKDKFKKFDDLKGHKIGTQLNTSQQTYAEEKFAGDVQGYDLNNVLIEQLKNKSVDALFLSELPAKEFAYLNKDLAYIDDIGVPDEEGFCVAVKKGNKTLVDQISKIVSELKDSGKVDTWLDENIELSHKEVEESK